MRVIVIVAAALLLTGVRGAGGDAPAEKAGEQVQLLATEADAVGWAFTALARYADPTYIRFVEIPPWGGPEWIGVVNFAVNAACSQTPVLVRGDEHANGWLLAFDLSRLAPDPVQLARLVGVWDSLAVRDARYHVPGSNVGGIEGAAFLAPHLAEALARNVTDETKSERLDVLVAKLTSSPGAIYPADFLIEQLLTSARGKYPEFRQMDFKVQQGTPFSERLRLGGFFRKESTERFGERGALLLNSGVTGKSRVVLTTFGVASRMPLAVTFDLRDSKFRPDQQFFRHLVEFEAQADASEALIAMACGLYEGVLADARGELQRTAPPDVVQDDTKPPGHTHELEMGMSCFVCHLPDNGYRTARNDMELLLGSSADYFGDEVTFNGKTLTKAEAVALVASRYGERIDAEPDGVLPRARRDFIRAVDVLTDYPVDPQQTSAQRLGAKLKEIYHGYRYDLVNAERACLELGVRVPKGRGLEVLGRLTPTARSGSVEDPMIPLLQNGAELKRDDFAAIYPELARRSVETRNTLGE